MVKGTKSGFHIEPGCPVRLATARLRRAWVVAHSRPAVDPTETALDPLATPSQVFGKQSNAGLFYGQEPHTKSKKNFPLELRAKTDSTYIIVIDNVIRS
jgi:hypothetical protein